MSPPFPDVAVLLGDPRLPDPTKVGGRFGGEEAEAYARMRDAFSELSGYRFSYIDDHERLLVELTSQPPSFALNFCDTGYRNVATRELHVPAILEMLGVPYSGAGPACLALCYDKALVRALAAAEGIPVPAEVFCRASDPLSTIRWPCFPAIVKPNAADGSVGIGGDAVVRDEAEALAYLARARRELPGRDLLIQEFLTGPEYGVGLIGNPASGIAALPVLEVDYERLDADLPRILAYESKSVPESPYWQKIGYRRAELAAGARELLVERSIRLFERLGCRDYARLDFRADARGEIKLLEVNPNPAWCWDGKLALMASFEGRDYVELLRSIVEAAQERVASTELSRSAVALRP